MRKLSTKKRGGLWTSSIGDGLYYATALLVQFITGGMRWDNYVQVCMLDIIEERG